MTGKKVLIVDDVADSGRTLEFVRGICAQYNDDDIRVAVLYQKPRSTIMRVRVEGNRRVDFLPVVLPSASQWPGEQG